MKRDAFSAEDTAQDGWSKTLMVPRSAAPHLLASGTRVGEVEIAGVIGEGSAGIVYLAFDPSLERRVAVKEYLPSALASRAVDGRVVVRSEGLMQAFRAGLDGFIAEARLLARFDHPSLVKVYRVWEANGTAYLVMPYYEGPTLTRMLAEADGPPDEALLRGLLTPLLDALEMIHDGGQLHRDISADNILLTAAGPVLLDFGVARRAIGGLAHAPTVVLKRGYAPIEQYGESDALKPGPWTDLYALGSVLHFAITGQAPGISVERLWDDWLEPLSSVAAGRYTPGFLAAVDAMMAVRPTHRPQDVAALRRLLSTADDGINGTVVVPAMPTVFAEAVAPAIESLRADPVTAVEWGATLAPAPVITTTGSRRSVLLALASVGLAIGFGMTVRSLTASVERGEAAPAKVVAAPAAASAASPSTAQISPVQTPAPVPVDTQITASAPAARPPDAAPVAASAPVGRRAVAAVTNRSSVAASKPLTVDTASTLPAPPVERAPTATTSARWPARCFDILQKASLERVSDEETAFLRETCR